MDEHDLVTVAVYADPYSSLVKGKDIHTSVLDFDDAGAPYISRTTSAVISSDLASDASYLIEENVEKHEEVSVFESVRATVKKDICISLNLHRNCEILFTLNRLMKGAVQFYELEYEQLAIVGCLQDLLFCQDYLTSHLIRKKSTSDQCRKILKVIPDEIESDDRITSGKERNNDIRKRNINRNALLVKANNNLHKYTVSPTEFNDTNGAAQVQYRNSLQHQQQETFNQRLISTDEYYISENFPLLQEEEVRVKSECYQFSCNLCSFRCSRRNHLLKHRVHHQKNAEIFSCDLCSFKTICRSQLGKHRKCHRQTSAAIGSALKSDITCDVNSNDECSSVSKSSSVDHHLRIPAQEENVKNIQIKEECKFLCKICNFQGNHRSEYKMHLESVHPIKYCCARCPYTTYKKVHYIRHMRSVHENKRPYICPVCSLAFKRIDALKQHQVIHLKEARVEGKSLKEPFKCEVCDKVVRSAAYLKEHLLTHSEERSFLCEICGASFKTRAVQRNHMRVVHCQNGKPFCQTCDKTFATKFSLSRHLTQHGIKSHASWSSVFFNSELLLASTSPPSSMMKPLKTDNSASSDKVDPIVKNLHSPQDKYSPLNTAQSVASSFSMHIADQIPYVIEASPSEVQCDEYTEVT